MHDPAHLPAILRRAASLACALGDGWIVPAGFEDGARRPLHPRGGVAVNDTAAAMSAEITGLNALQARGEWPSGGSQVLAGQGGGVLALLRTDAADPRFATNASLLLLNTDTARQRSVDVSGVLSGIDGDYATFEGRTPGLSLLPGQALALAPGELAVFDAKAAPKAAVPPGLDADAARRFADGPRVAIEAPSPIVEDGALPVKRLVGEVVAVEADIICDGHDKLAAVLRWARPRQCRLA